MPMPRALIWGAIAPLFLLACEQAPPAEQQVPDSHPTGWEASHYLDTSLAREALHDKLLGMLIGSAIGDALGAPTEMWARTSIELEHGFVDSLDIVMRVASPEGPWAFNLPAGGTTDDTRWKKITVEFLKESEQERPAFLAPTLDPNRFANFIVKRYLEEMAQLKEVESFSPEPFEEQLWQMAWLQEWAVVARPFAEGDMQEYQYALSRFYGGEMACAGMLYAPAIGAFYPGRPEMAYQEAFRLGIFDIGYARDIGALTAAMTAAALSRQPHADSVVNVIRDIDPYGFFRARLIGRSAYRWLKEARKIVYLSRRLNEPVGKNLKLPAHYPHDTLYFLRTQKAYRLLDEQLQDVPFHAGEVHLITLTAILFAEMDFQKAMEFIINYGRDNDTAGAVAGAILGAYHGAGKLPPHLAETVLNTNKEGLNINLEELAEELTTLIWKRRE